MSTLMSTDIHLTRSSTRLHAPPGGASSFSLSDGSTNSAPSSGRRKSAGKLNVFTEEPPAAAGNKPKSPKTKSPKRGGNASSMSSILSHEEEKPKGSPKRQAGQSSMTSLMSHTSEQVEVEGPKKKRNSKGGNGDSMANTLNQQQDDKKTSVRVRQAPGGRSSLVLG